MADHDRLSDVYGISRDLPLTYVPRDSVDGVFVEGDRCQLAACLRVATRRDLSGADAPGMRHPPVGFQGFRTPLCHSLHAKERRTTSIVCSRGSSCRDARSGLGLLARNSRSRRASARPEIVSGRRRALGNRASWRRHGGKVALPAGAAGVGATFERPQCCRRSPASPCSRRCRPATSTSSPRRWPRCCRRPRTTGTHSRGRCVLGREPGHGTNTARPTALCVSAAYASLTCSSAKSAPSSSSSGRRPAR
jgi:hypothetical protein